MANEQRLIDANKLKWKLGQVTLYVKGLRFGETVLSKILESYRRAVFEEIDEAPTVDAVEVVRCKDCKQWNVHGTYGKKILGECGLLGKIMNYEDFCSRGERRTDG